MDVTEIFRSIALLIILIAIPIFFYYLIKVIRISKTVKIRANWEDIQMHISLDKLEQKMNSWKEKGYNVDELETLIEHVRKQ